MPYPEIAEPAHFLVNDDLVIQPPPPGTPITIVRKPTIGDPPANTPLPKTLDGEVVIKVGDKITTDHIMPAGVHMKLRSNIPKYARVVFECFNDPDQPTFAERAETVRDAGRHGLIVARDSYGQGSSREHAAICPMYLGVKAVVALAIERIHAANLVNFGILPLLFAEPGDYDRIEPGDRIAIPELRQNLAPGKALTATVRHRAGGEFSLPLQHRLTDEDIRIILAGGRLHCG
jgi:aconitate hydratase